MKLKGTQKFVSVRVIQPTHDRVKEYAIKTGMSMYRLVDKAILEFVENHDI